MKNQTYVFITSSVLIIVLFILSIKKVERWTQQDLGVVFLSKNETASFLEEDKDRYVKSLSPVDLYARKSNDASHYISKIKRCASFFTDIEKAKLKYFNCS